MRSLFLLGVGAVVVSGCASIASPVEHRSVVRIESSVSSDLDELREVCESTSAHRTRRGIVHVREGFSVYCAD